MTEDGSYTAVLDRFEGELAVLILEADGEAIDDLVVPADDLPEGGRETDTVFTIEITDGAVSEVAVEETVTDERADRAQDRFDRLSRRPDSPNEDSAGDQE